MNESVVFNAAVKLPKEQRPEFLDAACAGNPQLRSEVEGLLREHDTASGFLSRPAANPPATDIFRPITEGPGTIIGPYKLLQQIGEGGFGVVYMAEQQRPVRRKVALKIIKPGMDTREVIARFESERQALALMDHPNIARVLDAGATESGRPYFVMELVKGVPITEYCDKNALPTDKRLALFITICHAVQHAHQKGVIHRDLKPSNVMVTLHDGQPVPKVIDFGVSKATSQQLTERTLFTAYGQMIGTPAYMSPEQAEMSGLDIDTRSDLYSLGVLLYELLTGTTPFDGKRLREAGYIEMQRIIREEAPPRPSTRVSTLGEALTILSNQRSTDPKKLGQQLRGDLDVIVMKALEKERSRRYDTPNAFADDLQRFLNHEAIVARPASAAYRLKKFAQRNMVAVSAGFAVAATLLIGTILSTALAIHALGQRNLAQRQQLIAESAQQEAERQRDAAEKAKQAEGQQRQLALDQKQAAENAQQAATVQRAAAEEQRDKVTSLNESLKLQEEKQRRLLYGAQMSLIKNAWDSDNTDRVRDLLNATRPRPGEQDFRGFEWNYWQRQMHAEDRTIALPLDPVNRSPTGAETLESAEFSADGKLLATIDRLSPWLIRVWEIETRRLLFEKSMGPARLAGERRQTTRQAGESPRTTGQVREICFVNAERIGWVIRDRGSLASQANQDGSYWQRMVPARLQVFDLASGEEVFSKEIEYNAANIVFTHFVASRDGSRVAASLKEPVVQVWDGRTGEEVTQVPIPTSEGLPRISEYLALSPDGTKLAVKPSIQRSNANEPVGITIVDVGSGKSVVTPPLMLGYLEFSPDGTRLAALTSSDALKLEGRIFDATTGADLTTAESTRLPNNERFVSYGDTLGRVVRFSPDGQRFAFPGGERQKVTLCSTASVHVIHELKGRSSPILQVAFSADGSRLVSAHANGTITFWPLPPVASPMPPNRTVVNNFRQTSPDGRWEYGEPVSVGPPFRSGVAPEDNQKTRPRSEPRTLGITDTTGKVLERVLPISRSGSRPHFSPDGQYVALLEIREEGDPAQATELKVWNLVTGNEALTVRLPAADRPLSTLFPGESPLGFPRLTPGLGPDGQPTSPRTYVGMVTLPAFSADGKRLAMAVRDGAWQQEPARSRIHIWDLADGHELVSDPCTIESISNKALEFHGELLVNRPSLRIAPTLAGRIATPGGSSSPPPSGIQVWNARTGQFLWQDARPLLTDVSPDGLTVAGVINGVQSPEIVLWKADSGEQCWTLPTPDSVGTTGNVRARSLSFHRGGSVLAVVANNLVAYYDVAQGTEQAVLRGHQGIILAVGFSADGSRIATAAADSLSPGTISRSFYVVNPSATVTEIKIWDASTGQELLSLPGFPGERPPARFSTQIGLFSSRLGFPTLELTPHAVRMRDDRAWEAAPLSAEAAATELAFWLNKIQGRETLLTRAELVEHLDADQSLDAATRSLALKRAGLQMARNFVDRGKASENMGQLDAAMRAYDEAIRLEPAFALPYKNRGYLWKQKGEINKALQDYDTAIRLDPKSAALNDRAWLRATHPDAKYRDGKQAVADATLACENAGWKSGGLIDTLAAAYAETGDFVEAVKRQEQAIALATDKDRTAFESRLALYRAGKPYRE